MNQFQTNEKEKWRFLQQELVIKILFAKFGVF